MPAIATDGGTAKLMKLPGTSPALELAARRLADAFRTSAENEAVSLPPLFWSLPGPLPRGRRLACDRDRRATPVGMHHCPGRRRVWHRGWGSGGSDSPERGYRAPRSRWRSASAVSSPSPSAASARPGRSRAGRPKTCGPRPSIVASAGCTARAGQELSASLVLRRRPPRGIYRTFIVAADATGTRTVLAVRPFVVSPKKAKPTRGRPMPARAAR